MEVEKNYIVKINLVNGEVLSYKTDYWTRNSLEEKMENKQETIQVEQYIIPKSSINYIEIVEKEETT